MSLFELKKDLSILIKNHTDKQSSISGTFGASRAFTLASITDDQTCQSLVISPDVAESEKLFSDTKIFSETPDQILFFDPEDSIESIKQIERIIAGENVCVFCPVSALLAKVSSSESLLSLRILLTKSMKMSTQMLITALIKAGYQRVPTVSDVGDFAVRGGIIDVYPAGQQPVRAEFLGDKIATLRVFDVSTQRSGSLLSSAGILPLLSDQNTCLLELMQKDTKIYIDEPDRFESIPVLPQNSHRVALHRFAHDDSDCIIECLPADNYYMDFSVLPKEIHENSGRYVVISRQSARVRELFFESGYETQRTEFVHGGISEGFIIQALQSSFISDKELFNEQFHLRKFRQKSEQTVSKELHSDFSPDDYVVHKTYGIGQYLGIENQIVGGISSDYLLVRYAGSDKLFIPIDQMHLVARYKAHADAPPKLNRLGTTEWAKAKQKAKQSIKDMTKELLEIYAGRSEGFAFPPDSTWQEEFEEAFDHEETADQIKALKEIKADMESSRPMDRLLCGDVGYGKTEIAMRAAFKAACAGKQVAVIAPTTILAEQHYLLFKSRFAPFPFNVDMLSRFRTKAEKDKAVRDLESGAVDVIIGTHAILQKRMKFKNLGLLIIDEEQRFGVEHKEKHKKDNIGIDVLTLSATPIPRTLYMSLSGIWDMSVINTPPPGRSAIETVVAPWTRDAVKEAVMREIERKGQVFYVHNRVESIQRTAERLKTILPSLRVVVAHGQMNDGDLERVMTQFIAGKHDVLVCTTIIESGLDIPNVNTIIIDDPGRLGLASLYQLRGRVGRSSVRAYAYLLYEKGDVVSERSLERLTAIQSFARLGSGYKIAMRDLEIRGSGNVLGSQQHGHMMIIGFDMYCELLKEASGELKGIRPVQKKQAEVDMIINAFIPSEYIGDDQERVSFYRRLSIAEGLKELAGIKEELRDRFGIFPEELENLFLVVELRIEATNAGVKKIKQKGRSVTVSINGKDLYMDMKILSEQESVQKVINAVKQIVK